MHIRHSFQTYLKCHGQIFQMFSTTQSTTTETAAAAAITAANGREKKTILHQIDIHTSVVRMFA